MSKRRLECVREMGAYTDRDAYVSDMALSSLWGDAEDAQIPQERIDELGHLWDVIHGGVKRISNRHRLSCRALAERFCVPYRTMENWSSGTATPAPYILLMMEEVLEK